VVSSKSRTRRKRSELVGFGPPSSSASDSAGAGSLGSTAKTLADSTANSAVVAVIAPICVDQFQQSADAANNLTALKKTSTWEQAAYVEKGGWATMPGSKAADSGVSQGRCQGK